MTKPKPISQLLLQTPAQQPNHPIAYLYSVTPGGRGKGVDTSFLNAPWQTDSSIESKTSSASWVFTDAIRYVCVSIRVWVYHIDQRSRNKPATIYMHKQSTHALHMSNTYPSLSLYVYIYIYIHVCMYTHMK